MTATARKPRRSPVQERSRLTVEAILEGAAQVFERHGYAAGTTNRIAERAGVSIGTLYQYFPDKDAILSELAAAHIAEGSRAVGVALAALERESPPLDEGLRMMVDGMIGLHRERPALHRVIFEESPRPAALVARLEALITTARDGIERWLDSRPEVTAPDTRLAADLVAQSIEGVTHGLVIASPGNGETDRYGEELVRMLGAYLTAR